MVEVSAGSVLVRHSLDGAQTLLIRVRAQAFELPKGHVEEGEAPQQAALRELREETGLLSLATGGELLGELNYGFMRDAGVVRKRVKYFRFAVSEPIEFGPRPKGTRELRWVNAQEAIQVLLVNEELRPLILTALKQHTASST